MPTNQDPGLTLQDGWELSGEPHRLLFGRHSHGLASLLRIIEDCVIARGKDGRVVLWNRAAEELYGWKASEALGKLPELLLKTKFPRPLSDIESELQQAGRWAGELSHTTRAGETVVVTSKWSLETDARGDVIGILQIERNLTQQRRLEKELGDACGELGRLTEQRLVELQGSNEALIESQARFQQVAEAIQDVFCLTNLRRTSVLYVNPAYEQLWGRPCHSLYADPRSWLEGIHAEDRPRMRQLFSEPISAHGYEHCYRVVRPDCSVRWVLDRGFPVREHAAGFSRMISIVRDITERRELEKELLAISEREQRRMGQELHDDLCQQLAGIEFLSQALQHELQPHETAAKAGEIAELIRGAIEHTRQLAKGLMPLEPEAEGLMHGLEALANRTSERFQMACGFECPARVPVADPAASTHLYRIAQEAVSNAIRHGNATAIKIVLARTPEGGRLSILDNGKGLPGADAISGGMGLGIMRYRADMIGGTFGIESNAPSGTMVVCTFPVTVW
ncbi:MAG TPA: PAS domain S-box protein [Candidatus Limnocylindrales bacterium]|nr:PAS domain S-box protein [Candidatus Limnocylindrales bacterium]